MTSKRSASEKQGLNPKRPRKGRPLERPPVGGGGAVVHDGIHSVGSKSGVLTEGCNEYEEYLRAVETLSSRGEVPVGQLRLSALEARRGINDYGEVLDFLADRGEVAVDKDQHIEASRETARAREELSTTRSEMKAMTRRHELEVQALRRRIDRMKRALEAQRILALVAKNILSQCDEHVDGEPSTGSRDASLPPP